MKRQISYFEYLGAEMFAQRLLEIDPSLKGTIDTEMAKFKQGFEAWLDKMGEDIGKVQKKAEEISLKEEKQRYLEFVLLTPMEHAKLIAEYGGILTGQLIERLNDYIGSKGAKYKSHYYTIRNWARKDMPQVSKPPVQRL